MKKLLLFIILFFHILLVFSQECLKFRAIHTGGNWGTNYTNLTNTYPPEYPPEYFNWLRNLGVNWVGISISLHLDNSLDSIVKRDYSASIPTYTDEVLVKTIQEFKNKGLNVYLTLAFEISEAEDSEFPVSRWQLGDPKMYKEDPNVQLENWPWALESPLHNQFVNSFFKSYTEQAVYFAKIAQAENVEMFSLGTETERLFRTRTGGYWPNNYKNHLKNMVGSVREVYSGLLTYDMSYDALTANDFYGVGSDSLWQDLKLDIVGISSYFKLFETSCTFVPSLDTLDFIWNEIIDEYFIPLKDRNPDLSIVLLEFGYVNDYNSPHQPNSNEFQTRTYRDNNFNGLDDEEEVQANIYESFYKAITNRGIIEGAFLWGNEIASPEQYEYWNKMKHFGIRNKLAESVIDRYYVNSNIDTSICYGSFIEIGDSTCTKSGDYSITLTNQFGCDSVVTLNLSVITVNTEVTLSGIALIADAEGATFQWLDCNDNYSPIVGAVSKSYSPIIDGNYAVQVSQNGCIDTSFCYTITGITYIENNFGSSLNIYPNPTNGNIKIELNKTYNDITIKLKSITGQIILVKNYRQVEKIDYFIREKPGIFILDIYSDEGKRAIFKIIKN